MPFETDAVLADDVGVTFGEYVTTFVSSNGQVRADIFRRNGRFEAHVSFPTGLEPDAVTDTYVSELWAFARERGLEDRIRMILSVEDNTVPNLIGRSEGLFERGKTAPLDVLGDLPPSDQVSFSDLGIVLPALPELSKRAIGNDPHVVATDRENLDP